jgi:hypothetical protein
LEWVSFGDVQQSPKLDETLVELTQMSTRTLGSGSQVLTSMTPMFIIWTVDKQNDPDQSRASEMSGGRGQTHEEQSWLEFGHVVTDRVADGLVGKSGGGQLALGLDWGVVGLTW